MVTRAAKLVNGKLGVSVIPDGVSADRIVDGTNNKVFTSAEKTKLSGLSNSSGGGGGASQTDIANAIATEGNAIRNALLSLFGNVNWKLDDDGIPYFTPIGAGNTNTNATVDNGVIGTSVVG